MILEKIKQKFPIKKKEDNTKIQFQFISFLAYFNAFLTCGENVYQALKSTSESVDGKLQMDASDLLHEIDIDKSINPFLHFANKFNNETISQIITMIYQFSVNGVGEDRIVAMIPLLDRLKNITINEYIKKESSDLNLYLSTPLIGISIVSVFFSLGVLATIMAGV